MKIQRTYNLLQRPDCPLVNGVDYCYRRSPDLCADGISLFFRIPKRKLPKKIRLTASNRRPRRNAAKWKLLQLRYPGHWEHGLRMSNTTFTGEIAGLLTQLFPEAGHGPYFTLYNLYVRLEIL
jgi:hypothetical protein